MKRKRLVLLALVTLLGSTLPLGAAAPPKFRPSGSGDSGAGRYVITLADDAVVEDAAAMKREVVQLYGAKLEGHPSSDVRQFTVTMTPARARLLSTDPRVSEVVEVSSALAPAAPAPTAASTARHFTTQTSGYGDNGQSGTYTYDSSGNITAIGTDTYLYDLEERLHSSVTRGVTETYIYDAFGNRQSATGAVNCLGQTTCAQPVTLDEHTNRLQTINNGAVQYDTAGNVTTIAASSGDPRATYTYDGTGMMIQETVGSDDRQFVYTADDERIAVRQGASWTWNVRDPSHKVLREFTSMETGGSGFAMTNRQWLKDYVWRDGLLLATTASSGTLHYHLDHLGTPRLVTNASGAKVAEHAYYPFGAEISLTPHEAPEEAMKFTGHERDIVAGDGHTLDYMHARYYSGTAGRFLTVDPQLHADRALHSPQMWNRYAYAIDNPMVFTDPTGTTVYLVTYTTGNSEGDDEFQRAAQTRAAEIEHQKGYDPKHDTVIVAGVQTKADFAAAVKQANGMFKQFGKVGEVSLFSHSGWHDGPVFHDASGRPTQFTASELDRVAVNWSDNAHACFFGCNTGVRFGSMFAESQRVTTYGFAGYAAFSSNPNHYERLQPTGPVYMMTVPPHQLRGVGMTSPWPMTRDDP